MEKHLITLHFSLPHNQLTLRVPKSIRFRDLKTQIIPYALPQDKDSVNEFEEQSLKTLHPRKSLKLTNPFLTHHETPVSSLATADTQSQIGSVNQVGSLDELGYAEPLYQCDIDLESLVIREKPLSSKRKQEESKKIPFRSKTLQEKKEDVFVYRGEVLDLDRTVESYSIPENSRIYYGKPTKIDFNSIDQRRKVSFYTTSESMAGELREMISKMGLLKPQEELFINKKAIPDYEIPRTTLPYGHDSPEGIQIEAKKKVLRVLSLDGGGIRGVAVATILEEIERATNKRIHELFDVVVGTSTGGLLAIMMTIPTKEGKILTAAEAKQIYIDKRYEMFKKNPWFKNTLANPRYTHEGFEQVTKDLYGDHTLRNAVIPMGVVVSDSDQVKPILMNSMRAQLHQHDYRHNVLIWQASRATSAAPTYFPPVILEGHISEKSKRSVSPTRIYDPPAYTRSTIAIEDGGTTANNPTLLAIKYAKSAMAVTGNNFQYHLQVVSIGTGNLHGFECPPPAMFGNGSLLQFISKFTKDPLFMARASFNVHNQVMDEYFDGHEGPGSEYFRIQFKITKEQRNRMDNCDPANIKGLIKAAQSYLFHKPGQYSQHFAALLQMLSEDVARPNLKLEVEYADCPVRTKYYIFLNNYFSQDKVKSKTRPEDPFLLRDIYEFLKAKTEEYKGSKIKFKQYQSWLLDRAKTELGWKLGDSITSYLANIPGNHLYLLPDHGLSDFARMRNSLADLNFGPVLSNLPIKGSIGSFTQQDKMLRSLAKGIRKEILDSQLYRDVCNIVVGNFEEIELKVHPPKKKEAYTPVKYRKMETI